MKLRLTAFERPVRAMAKREVNASAALRKERRGIKRAGSVQWVGSMLIWIAIAVGMGLKAGRLGPAQRVELIAIIGAYIVTIILAGRWKTLESESQAPLWRCLPLSGVDILRANLRTFRVNVWAIPVIYAAFYFAVASVAEGFSMGRACAMVALQTAATICAGLHFAAYLSGTRAAAWLVWAGVIFVALAFFDAGRALLLQMAPALQTGLPWGWAQRVAHGNDSRDWMFAAPLALWFAAAPASARRIRAAFLEKGPWRLDPTFDDEGPAEDDGRREGNAVAGSRGPTEIEEAIRGVELKGAERPAMDWIERLVFRAWNAEQRGVAEFLWPFPRNWAGALRTAGRILPVLAVIAWTLQRYLWDRGGSAVWLLIGLAVTFGAAPVGSTAPGLGATGSSGVIMPMYGIFPIGYDALYKTLLTANRIRVALWAPLYILYAAGIGWSLEGNAAGVATIAAKIAMIHLAIHPLLIAAWISSSTTTKGVLWMFVFLVLLATMVGAVIAIFWEDGFGASVWRGLATLLIAAKGAQWMHRFLYRRGKIDLTNRPKT